MSEKVWMDELTSLEGEEGSFWERVVHSLHRQKIALFLPVLRCQRFLNLL